MSPRVIEPSRDELVERRDELIAELQTSREELQDRADAGLLSGEEFYLWDEIESIEFLLGGSE
jgi:hypothetical protein